MVCIAAFIILCLASAFVGIIAIFRPKVGKRYWVTFQKAWGCVWKKVRFQKCETDFKSDIKNSILSKVIIKKPKLVKPISVAIEVVSVAIVLVAIWTLAVLIKGGLALIVFGNCDVRNPENCFTGSGVCSEVQPGPSNPVEAVGQWFGDFGTIGEGFWSKFKNWDAADYTPEYVQYYATYDETKPSALDIFDPGCFRCRESYLAQLDAGFFEQQNVAIMPYVLGDGEGNDKYSNATLISKYIIATYFADQPASLERPAAFLILNRLFTEFTADNVLYQSALTSTEATEQYVEDTLRTWLGDFGYTSTEVSYVSALAHSPKVQAAIDDFRHVATEQIHIDIPVVGVPTMLYNGNRHSGVYEP